MADRPKIYFCFPYHGVGGVSLLFMRMGSELARQGLADVTLVDYADGYMARHRDRELTSLAVYEDNGEVPIPADAVAVFQSMTPWSIFPGLRPSPDSRILFWNCHPFNLVPAFPGIRISMQRSRALAKLLLATALRRYRGTMRSFARELLTRRSLVFMDRVNVETTEDMLGLEVAEPVYLPIAAEEVAPRPPRALGPGLCIAWIGRIVDFKYFILLHALTELDRAAPGLGRPVSVTIVGDGDYRERLVASVRHFTQIEVHFAGEMTPAELDLWLSREVDMLMAMGTAALEGAKLGIPTLLLDVSYGTVAADYRFSWLHDRDGGTLGDFAHARRSPAGPESMSARLRELVDDNVGLGAAVYAYFRRVHALSVVARALSSKAASAECRWRDLETLGLTRRGLAYPLFKWLRKKIGK
jgi:hypothetical protein